MLKYLLASILLLCGTGLLTAQEPMNLGRETVSYTHLTLPTTPYV